MIKLDEIFRYSPDGDGATPPPASPPEKTFTQKELDEIIVGRLAKENAKNQKKLDEILKKLGVEDETKLDDVVVKVKEHDTYKTEAQTLKAEIQKNKRFNELRKLNVDEDFLEFALSKIDGEDDDKFVKNAQEFLKSNPKILKDNFQRMNSSLPLDGAGNVDLSKMTTEQYLEWRRKNKL